LDRLSSTIRLYVATETGLLLAGALAAWFWLVFALDYLPFALVGLDWVQVPGSRFVRGLGLALFGGGVTVALIARVAYRLLRDFSPSALALVLEKRYPELLGDRLITAVELSNTEQSEAFGYSPEMIAQTVRDAGERLDQVDIRAVFRWQRLAAMASVVAVLWLFVPVVVLGVMSAWQPAPLGQVTQRAGDLTAIWFERDLMLRNTIWPRRAYVELVGFPESGEMKVSTDAAPPRLTVRAWRWVVSDRKTSEGWRPMTWRDAENRLGDLPPLPAQAIHELVTKLGLAQDWSSDPNRWPLDRLEDFLERSDFRTGLDERASLNGRRSLEQVFERLTELAAKPGMARKLRRLAVPEEVRVRTWGEQTQGLVPLARGAEQIYTGPLTELTESVWFRIEALDYTSPARRITRVPPPRLATLTRQEARPAYLYHRPPQTERGAEAALELLRELKQSVPEVGISLGGALSEVEVPHGSDLVLRAKSDKPLRKAELQNRSPQPGGGSIPYGELLPLALEQDGVTFVVTYPDLVKPHDIDLVFTDADGITSRRHVSIKIGPQPQPLVEAVVPILRKTAQGIMVTPVANIPFEGTASLPEAGLPLGGIDNIEYVFGYQRIDPPAVIAARATAAAAVTQFLPPGNPVGLVLVPAYGLITANVVRPLGSVTEDRHSDLATFRAAVTERMQEAREPLTEAELRRRVQEPPTGGALIKKFDIRPTEETFDLQERLPELKVSDPTATVQPRYRLRVRLAATDNNLLTGPKVGETRETFTFLVVSEPELLAEINKDTETLALKMRDLVERVRDARLKLAKVIDLLPSAKAAEELTQPAVRTTEIHDTILKARDTAQEVLSDYGRILAEMQANRVTQQQIDRVQLNIVVPLDEARALQFPKAEQAIDAFRQPLDMAQQPAAPLPAEALQRTDELLSKLEAVLSAMDEVISIQRLQEMLAKIKDGMSRDVDSGLQEIKQIIDESVAAEFGEVDLFVEPVTLGPGQKATVRVGLDRFEYPSAVTIKLETPADSGLKVPAQVVAPRNSKEVTFEITAGSKSGNYTLKLSARNSPKGAELKVTVK
jgi:hypothetical protein